MGVCGGLSDWIGILGVTDVVIGFTMLETDGVGDDEGGTINGFELAGGKLTVTDFALFLSLILFLLNLVLL